MYIWYKYNGLGFKDTTVSKIDSDRALRVNVPENQNRENFKK